MYQSIMWSYIKEEKELLLKLLDEREVKENIKVFENIQAMYFVAHGSSYNAANAIAPILSGMTGMRIYVYTPSALIHNALSLHYEEREKVWICAISQTGTSRGVLNALDYVKEMGFHHLLGITNEKDTPLEEKCSQTFKLNCQKEDSNAKTKGYSSTLLLILKIALEISRIKRSLSEEKICEIYEKLKEEILEIDATISKTLAWCQKNKYGLGMSHAYIIGNGINQATAMEGMLKLMETLCVPTMFSDIQEFSHGMHRSVKENSYVILLNTEKDRDLTEKTFYYLLKKNVHVLMLDNCSDIEHENIIKIRKEIYTDSVLLMSVALQTISVFVPEINGFDPNRNANDDYTECAATRI